MRPFPELDAPLSDGTVSLRRFTLNDVADVTRALQDPEVVRWTASIPTPYTESDAKGWIEQHGGMWSTGATAPFAIVHASDDRLLGGISVNVRADVLGRVAMGYWVAEWSRKRGSATRALLIATEWAVDCLNPHELYLQILEGNVASERVAEKAGYVFAGYRSTDFTRPASRGTPETLRVKEWVRDPRIPNPRA